MCTRGRARLPPIYERARRDSGRSCAVTRVGAQVVLTARAMPVPCEHVSSHDQKVKWPEARDEVLKLRVIVWTLHDINVVEGHFGIKFRLTMFWRPRDPERCLEVSGVKGQWNVFGRTLAKYTAEQDDDHEDGVEIHEEPVPPISLLNATDFGEVSPIR